MKLLLWQIRYFFNAWWVLKCWPRYAWYLAIADEGELYREGYSPDDALHEEMSYWSD